MNLTLKKQLELLYKINEILYKTNDIKTTGISYNNSLDDIIERSPYLKDYIKNYSLYNLESHFKQLVEVVDNKYKKKWLDDIKKMNVIMDILKTLSFNEKLLFEKCANNTLLYVNNRDMYDDKISYILNHPFRELYEIVYCIEGKDELFYDIPKNIVTYIIFILTMEEYVNNPSLDYIIQTVKNNNCYTLKWDLYKNTMFLYAPVKLIENYKIFIYDSINI